MWRRRSRRASGQRDLACRTVAAWALTPSVVHRRDKSYQRGFPTVADERSPVDRGHLIPHMSGDEFGPNIFRQDRSLNQGRSEQGKRYRALERAAATVPGALYFGHLLYADDTAGLRPSNAPENAGMAPADSSTRGLDRSNLIRERSACPGEF